MDPPPTLVGRIFTHAIAVVAFVIVPILITLVVPFTDLEFRRSGSGASVTVHRFVLMSIPWHSKQIENVKQIRAETTSEYRYQDTSENRRLGRAGATRHATGKLTIVNDGPEVLVQVAPELAKDIEARFHEFVTAKAAEPLRLSVYASWRLSYLLGGAVTFLCALYVIGSLLAALTSPFTWLRSYLRT